MTVLELAILAAVCVWLFVAVRRMRKDKKNGKGCGGHCAGCPGCTEKGEKP